MLFKDGSDDDQLATKFKYEDDRNVIDWVENGLSPNLSQSTFGTTISKYNYTNDALGRRTDVDYSGTAFAAAQYLTFGYNDRSELDEADRYSNSAKTTHFASKGEFDFTYDKIGNRETYQVDISQQTPTTDRTYTSNDVNQYTNSTDPTEDFDYDADGNLTADGTYTYEWNGENRLIAVYPTSPINGSKKMVSDYDYMGRRVRKRVYTHDGSEWPTTTSADWQFVYDQWNLVLNWDDDSTTSWKFTWGLDLSRSVHGAGGVGGLLAMDSGATDFYFLRDANGNVTQVIAAASSVTAAKYEYDPYGNKILATGIGNWLPFRFSTKYSDREVGTELYYYGYRYYSPTLGRWISRDPISELGHMVLKTRNQPKSSVPQDPAGMRAEQHSYRFVLNQPTDLVDPHGLKDCGVTIHKAKKQLGWEEILAGHEWIETSDTSYGYWPTGSVWHSEGKVESPDTYAGDRSGPAWQTHRAEWGPWLSLVFRKPGRLHFGSGKGRCCTSATCPMIKDCIKQWAAYTNNNDYDYNLTNKNCRWWVDWALKYCCLYRGKKS